MEFDDGIGTPNALTPGRLLTILRRQWWVIVACLVLAGGGAFAYSRTGTTSFAALAPVSVTQLATSSVSAPSTPLPSALAEIKSRAVVTAARRAAGAGNTVRLSESAPSATSIDIIATSANGPAASRAALAAAGAFVTQRQHDISVEVTQLTNSQITPLSNELDAIDKNGSKPTAAALTTITAVRTQLLALNSNLYALKGASGAIHRASTQLPTFTSLAGSRKQIFEVALVAGLLIGCGIALVSEQLDDRLRSVSELSEIGGPGLLAELPTRPGASRSGSIVDNPHDELSEAVRELRTALRFLSVERPLRTLLVTSPAAGEGKSFVAANLAASFALSGVRTVLVSSDLRRPRLESLLETPTSVRGLSDAIADAALASRRPPPPGSTPEQRRARQPVDVGRLLQPTGIEDLRLLPAGASPPNPAELLGSVHMTTVLEDLQARADVVILDSPPVLAVTDALVLTAHADGVIVVLAKGRSSRGASRRALRLLNSGLAPVFGVVVNRSTRADLVPYPYFEAEAQARARGLQRLLPRRRRAGRRRASDRTLRPSRVARRA